MLNNPTEPPRFIETIRLVDGQAQLLHLHRERMIRTGEHFHFTAPALPTIETLCPNTMRSGVVKCRILYSRNIESIEFIPYTPRPCSYLKLVNVEENFSYRFKFADRTALNLLANSAKGSEILMVSPDGFILDTSYTNVLLHPKDAQDDLWHTPQTPLLQGVQRQHLLDCNRIEARPIHINDLPLYDTIGLINAMLPMESMPRLPIERVIR